MKIITYNVNGIRSALSKGLLECLEKENADIVCIQETKAQPAQVPVFDLEAMGYKSFWHSAEKKGYSGVAIFTKSQPDKVQYGMGDPLYDKEGRILRADFGDVSVMSLYIPSGSSGDVRQDFKMQFLEDFLQYIMQLKQERSKLIICGDYNICHKPIDIHDPVRNAKSSGFLPEEREWLSRFIDSGFTDSFRILHPEPHKYSWWSYRANARANNKGWRIDYNMVSDNLSDRIQSAKILKDEIHSDHCPVVLEMEM